MTVRLWEASTGTLQQTVKAEGVATTLEFSEDSPYLITDLGSFRIQINIQSRCSNNTSYSLRENGAIFVQERQWIVLHGKKALWLPPEYRPTCSAVKDGTLALGHASGRVSFIRFLESNRP
jgi:hypothetical protein